jgi:N,N-dimethylformamidase
MSNETIHGYSDRISVAPGDGIRFMVSATGKEHYQADIVRLIRGDANPQGPGFKEEIIETTANCVYPARHQPVYSGSHVLIDDKAGTLNLGAAITLHAYIMPTTVGKGVQGILTRWDPQQSAGWALVIDEQRRLALWLGDKAGHLIQIAVPVPLVDNVWYSAGASYDGASGLAILDLRPVVNSVNCLRGPVAIVPSAITHEVTAERIGFRSEAPTVIAGWSAGQTASGAAIVSGHYNGKIDRPRVYGRALAATELAELAEGREPERGGALAQWDFALGINPSGIATDHVVDGSGNGLHGNCVNAPARGMTGRNWTGGSEHFVHAPAEYGAIHFHDDDLEDAGWDGDFELEILDSMRSGIYAARLRIEKAIDYVPFFVRRPAGQPTAKVAFLAPTASYMAYANEHMGLGSNIETIMGRTTVVQQEDLYLYEHPELGLSIYDVHSDGSGVCYSSLL